MCGKGVATQPRLVRGTVSPRYPKNKEVIIMNCPSCQWRMRESTTVDENTNPVVLYNCQNQTCPYDETIRVPLSAEATDIQHGC